MASISVRKLDDTTYQRLRIQAAKHGISLEEEVRQILKCAVVAPERASSIFHKYFGTSGGINLKTPNHKPHKPLDFNK